MRGVRRGARPDAQASTEFALILGAIAVGCIIVLLLFSGTLAGRFDSDAEPFAPGGPLLPPTPTVPELTFPTSIDQCKNGGWQTFPQFGSEEACLDYLSSP